MPSLPASSVKATCCAFVVLQGGHVQQIGAPADVYDRPVNAFVAGFIGESNLLRVRVEACEQGVARLRSERGDVLQAQAGALVPGQTVQALLRPEQFHLGCPADAGCASLEGTVEQTLFVGKDFEVTLRSVHGEHLKAVVRDASRQALQRLQDGNRLHLWYRLDAVHLIPENA